MGTCNPVSGGRLSPSVGTDSSKTKTSDSETVEILESLCEVKRNDDTLLPKCGAGIAHITEYKAQTINVGTI